MKKVLIIRFSSIGDIVLTSPVIRCIKKQVPDIEIHYLTKSNFSTILNNNPYLNKVITLDHSLNETIKKIKNENYDLIIDLHNNLRTFFIKLICQIPSNSFNKLNLKKWIYTNFKINLMPDIHIVDRYLQTTVSLNVKNDHLGLDYFINEENIKIDQPLINITKEMNMVKKWNKEHCE